MYGGWLLLMLASCVYLGALSAIKHEPRSLVGSAQGACLLILLCSPSFAARTGVNLASARPLGMSVEAEAAPKGERCVPRVCRHVDFQV